MEPYTPRPADMSMSLKGSAQPGPREDAGVVHVPEGVTDRLGAMARRSPLDPDVWDRVLSEAGLPARDRETIVSALRHGVPLTFDDDPVPARIGGNHPLLYLDKDRLSMWMDRELNLGRYVAVPPEVCTPADLPHRIPMGVAPRFSNSAVKRQFRERVAGQLQGLLRDAASDDFRGRHPRFGPGVAFLLLNGASPKWRIISDCSAPNLDGLSINDLVDAPYFDMPSPIRFAMRLTRGMYIWKSDVVDAFRLVPIRFRDIPLLAFFVDGVLYVDTRLNFGHTLSPYYFVNFVQRPILYVAMARGASVLGALQAFVDDFFGAARTREDAHRQMQLWLRVCSDLGVPVSAAKTFLPARVMEILGFVINTDQMTISVSPTRLADIVSEMNVLALGEHRSIRRDDLESLVGKLSFVCPVIPGGRTFMRETLDLLAATKGKGKWIRLSAGFRRDAAWWRTFASTWNGVEPIPPKPRLLPSWFGSDASGLHGLGLFVAGLGIHLPLSLETTMASDLEKQLIIAEAELFALVALVAIIAPHLQGEHVLIPVDNTNVVSWVSRGTARGRPRAMRALRILWRISARFRFRASLRYIPSAENSLADAASHFDTLAFDRLVSVWSSTHPSFSSSGVQSPNLNHHARALIAINGGHAGRAVYDLVQYMVQGDDAQLFVPQGQVDALLQRLPEALPGLLASEPDRLRDVPSHGRQFRGPACLEHNIGIPGLRGPACAIRPGDDCQPRVAPSCGALHERSRPIPGQTGQEGGAMHAPAPADPKARLPGGPDQCSSSDRSPRRCSSFLGLPPPRDLSPEIEPHQGLPYSRSQGAANEDHAARSGIQDDPVQREGEASGSPVKVRKPDMPSCSTDPLDDDARLARPIIPDFIRLAISETSRRSISFRIPEAHDRHPGSLRPPATHGTFLPERLRASGPLNRSPDRPPHAPRGLAFFGGRPVLRGGSTHSKSPGDLTVPPSSSIQTPSSYLEGSSAPAALFSGGDILQTPVPQSQSSDSAHFISGSFSDSIIAGDVFRSEPRYSKTDEGLATSLRVYKTPDPPSRHRGYLWPLDSLHLVAAVFRSSLVSRLSSLISPPCWLVVVRALRPHAPASPPNARTFAPILRSFSEV